MSDRIRVTTDVGLLRVRQRPEGAAPAPKHHRPRQDLRAVTKKCRPDWDITTPAMKLAWNEGRKELFYPYGRTYAQTLGEQD